MPEPRIVLDEQLDYLAGTLPAAPARLLDAGCGRGHLAAALQHRGYDVTAIDSDAESVVAAQAGGVPALHADITDYADDPFDAVIFSLSLHHVDPVDAAIARARALLRPGGLLVLDEFAWDRADRSATTWFYDACAVLTAAGLLPDGWHGGWAAGSPETGPVDPLVRWQHHHAERDPMNTGSAMVDAVTRRFPIVDIVRTPYLYRYLSGWLDDDPTAPALFNVLRAIEVRRIAEGSLAAVGLHLVARY